MLYVDELIGKGDGQYIPPATFDAFRDHGKLRASLTEDVEAARHVMDEQKRLGLNLDAVTETLVTEGCASFCDAFDQLLGAVCAEAEGDARNKVLKQSVSTS